MEFHTACPLTCLPICRCSLGSSALPLFLSRSSKPATTFASPWKHLSSPLRFLTDFCKNPNALLHDSPTLEVLVPKLPVEQRRTKRPVAAIKAAASGPLPALLPGVSTSAGATKRTAFGKKSIARVKATPVPQTPQASPSGKGVGKDEPTSVLRAHEVPGGPTPARTDEEAPGGKAEEKTPRLFLKPKPKLKLKKAPETTGMAVPCGLCGGGEEEGSAKAERMRACHKCARRFHASCLATWAGDRDAFEWKDWVCATCRECQVSTCHTTPSPGQHRSPDGMGGVQSCEGKGEEGSSMFCKRCDVMLHCHCVQPPLKAPPRGPFLCSAHTQCQSCLSLVPGSGTSSRWFLAYSLCDACGRLFVKHKFCPVCLKVYRDTEPSPMVCCDSCQKWVHIACDDISEDMYEKFQSEHSMGYTCAACRGTVYKVKDLADATRELWRRREEREGKKEPRAPPPFAIRADEEEAPKDNQEKKGGVGAEVEGAEKVKKKKKKMRTGEEKVDDVGVESSGKKREAEVVVEGSKGMKRRKGEVEEEEEEGGGGEGGGVVELKKKGPGRPKKDKEVILDEQREGGGEVEKEASVKGKRGVRGGGGTRDEGTGMVRGDGGGGGGSMKLKIKSLLPLGMVQKKRSEKGAGRGEKGKVNGGEEGAAVEETKGGAEEAQTRKTQGKGKRSLKKRKRGEEEGMGGGGEEHKGEEGKGNGVLQGDGAAKGVVAVGAEEEAGGAVVGLKYGGAKRGRKKKAMKVKQEQEGAEEGEGEGEGRGSGQTEVVVKEDGVDARSPGGGAVTPEGGEIRRLRKPNTLLKDMDTSVRRRSKTISREVMALFKDVREEGEEEESAAATPLRRLSGRAVAEEAEVEEVEKETRDVTTTGARSKRKKGAKEEEEEEGKEGLRRQQSPPHDALRRLGRKAVNRRVEVYWKDDDQWYPGTVVDVVPNRERYVVLYDDGEQELLKYGQEKVRLLPKGRV